MLLPRASLADVVASHRDAVARALADAGVAGEGVAAALVDELVEDLRRLPTRRPSSRGSTRWRAPTAASAWASRS